MAFDFTFIHSLLVKAIAESQVLKAPTIIYKTLTELTAGSGSHCFPFIAADYTDKQASTALNSYNHLLHNQESLLKSICLNINRHTKYTQAKGGLNS